MPTADTTQGAMTPCGDCGMPCRPTEYHPYAACLMFKACHNSKTVRANLDAVRAQDPAPQGPSDAELEAARAAFDWDGWTDPKAAQRGFAREVLTRWGAAPQPPDELSPEFTDTARAALLWVLWHHQGASSPVGQPIRFALGMGQHDRLEPHQLAEAKRWERLHPVNPSVWAPRVRPLTAERIEAIWVEHGLDDCDPEGFARRIEADHGITGAPDGHQQT